MYSDSQTVTTDGIADTHGKVVAIRGGIVDASFPSLVPHIDELVYAGDIPLQVMILLGENTVRCIALSPVRGLGLGTAVRATGAPIKVPVGGSVLGRMLNVFGEPIDRLPAPETAERRSIHHAPPTLEDAGAQARSWKPASRQLICFFPSNAAAKPACSAVPVSARPF